MAQPKRRAKLPTQVVRAGETALRARLDELLTAGGTARDWRRLQFDLVQAVVEAQSELIAIHGEMLGMVRSDRELYARLRQEALDLRQACEALRELARQLEPWIARLD